MTDSDVGGPTPVYNQDLKNPHLVETAVFFSSLQGPIISEPPGNPSATSITALQQAASAGDIPTIERTFRIEGVPLILTDQSYLVLNLEPVFLQKNFNFVTPDSSTAIPNYFHVMHSNWPKISAACIKEAKCTLSNFGLSNTWPFYYNYINALSASESVTKNSKLGKFWTFTEYMRGGQNSFAYFGRDPEVVITGNIGSQLAWHVTRHSAHTLAYSVIARKNSTPTAGYTTYQATWNTNNMIEVRIPLREIMPAFSVPVLPLMATNAAQIELTVTFYDPRYMFMLSQALIPNVNYSIFKSTEQVPQGFNETYIQMADAASDNFSIMDIRAYAYLNLKVITDPALNPLSKAYLEPFLVKADFFRAGYLDYYIMQNNVTLIPGQSNLFHFKPAQLFYNLTHAALFFYDGGYPGTIADNTMQTFGNIGQLVYSLQNARAQSLKGHFVLGDHITVTGFQVGLGSANVPLFSNTLSSPQMQQMTVDYFQKYGRNNMVGDVVQSGMRLSQGDAFYVIDFTHAKNAGYFVDTDNMINISGYLNWTQPPASLQGYTGVMVETTARQISVILVLFYTNNLEILLDQGGSVLVSQV